MKSIKKTICEKLRASLDIGLGFLVFGLWVLLFAGWVFGMSHAFDKHGTFAGMLTLVFPPAAIYYAPEALLWHDDSKKEDWDTRLATDQKNISYMLTGVAEELSPTDRMQLEEAILAYSKQIQDYPEKQRLKLREFAREFIKYSMVFQEDLFQTLKKSIAEGTILVFQKSGETMNIEKELIEKYPHISEVIEQGDLALESANLQLSNKDAQIDSPEKREQFEILLSQMRLNLEARNKLVKETYKKLFGVSFEG